MVLIAARHLVDRLRHPRSRADELAALRRRFAGARGDAELSALAAELRAAKLALAGHVGTLGSCARCARGHPLPAGRWPGGQCCSGDTLELFDEPEVAALALAGTRPGALRPPRGDHAGCAFRGERGCTVAPADRPSICVHYLCRDAARELHARGALDEAERLVLRLGRARAAFREAFAAARDR